MDLGSVLGLLAIVVLIAVNGVFVAAEFALVAADRSRIDAAADQGSRRAGLVRSLLRHLSFHLSGAQLGITVTSLLIGFLAEPVVGELIQPLLEPIVGPAAVRAVSVTVALILATVVQMVAGELTPKTVAVAKPEASSLFLAPFLQVYGVVFGPLIRVLNRAANWAVRRLGVEPKEELASVRSLAELSRLAEASAEEGTIGDTASTLFTRSLRFAGKSAADALVPRVKVSALATDETASDLVARSATTGYSRFPVFRTDLDDVVGVVLVKSVHGVAPAARSATTVEALMTDIVVVPETRSLQGVLADLRDARSHLAVVVDEYGGTAGIITLEDVLEEIVGEIDDEHDVRPSVLTPAGGRSGPWDLPGSLHPDEVLDATGFEPPDGEYETLAGFVLDQLGHIPAVGDQFEFEGWKLRVAGMDGLRVDLVELSERVQPVDVPDEPDEPDEPDHADGSDRRGESDDRPGEDDRSGRGDRS
jgi:CBS domain containing-hemolysin-like protein